MKPRCCLPLVLLCLLPVAGFLPAAAAQAQCAGGVCQPAVPGAAAVVRVVNETGNERCYGSGTLIYADQDRGVVLTCAHLFRRSGGRAAVVFSDGQRFDADVLAVDRAWDLAALAIARPPYEPVAVAQEYPRPGEPLRSCGYGPAGRYWCNQGQALGYVKTGQTDTYETLELSGAAREGDSGGPVLNGRGELVAVLWGTDGRTVGGTYCGRIRKFLAAILARLRGPSPEPQPEPGADPADLPAPSAPSRLLTDPLEKLRQRLDDQERNLGQRVAGVEKVATLISGLKDRLEKTEGAVEQKNLHAVVRQIAVGVLAEQGPRLLESVLPALLAALGWTGPPSIAAVFALRLVAGVLQRRVQKRIRRKNSGTASQPKDNT